MAEAMASQQGLGAYDNSQSSSISSQGRSGYPTILQSSSNGSASTLDTDNIPVFIEKAQYPTYPIALTARPELSRESSSASDLTNSDNSTFTPDEPYIKSTKRTASGALKHPSPTRVARVQNLEDGATAIKVNKLTSDLQNRLKYAMLKVQLGMESQSIDQVEHRFPKPQHHAPESPATQISRRASISSEAYMLSPIARVSPTYESSRILQRQMERPMYSPSASDSDDSSLGRSILAPAPQLTSLRRPRARTFGERLPRALQSVNARKGAATGLSQAFMSPQGPQYHGARPNVIQNQAEKDAIDTLLFMSSPNNSKNMKYSSQASPPFKAKRVEFDMRGLREA